MLIKDVINNVINMVPYQGHKTYVNNVSNVKKY